MDCGLNWEQGKLLCFDIWRLHTEILSRRTDESFWLLAWGGLINRLDFVSSYVLYYVVVLHVLTHHVYFTLTQPLFPQSMTHRFRLILCENPVVETWNQRCTDQTFSLPLPIVICQYWIPSQCICSLFPKFKLSSSFLTGGLSGINKTIHKSDCCDQMNVTYSRNSV